MGTDALLWPVKVPTPTKPPPVVPPPPLPEAEQPEIEEEAVKKIKRKRGWEQTMITGELVPTPTKKTTLG